MFWLCVWFLTMFRFCTMTVETGYEVKWDVPVGSMINLLLHLSVQLRQTERPMVDLHRQNPHCTVQWTDTTQRESSTQPQTAQRQKRRHLHTKVGKQSEKLRSALKTTLLPKTKTNSAYSSIDAEQCKHKSQTASKTALLRAQCYFTEMSF